MPLKIDAPKKTDKNRQIFSRNGQFSCQTGPVVCMEGGSRRGTVLPFDARNGYKCCLPVPDFRGISGFDGGGRSPVCL